MNHSMELISDPSFSWLQLKSMGNDDHDDDDDGRLVHMVFGVLSDLPVDFNYPVQSSRWWLKIRRRQTFKRKTNGKPGIVTR